MRRFPTTILANLKQLRTVYGALLIANVLYLWIVRLMPPLVSFRSGFWTTVAAAVWTVLNLYRGHKIRSDRLLPALNVLRSRPDDPDAVAQLRGASTIGAALASSVTVVGFAFHFLGRSLPEVIAFLVASSAALIAWWPREP